jgi:glycine cleavage system aminomethyltransferase T/glycine/D-amino acid oxidase-like deaminating enzyme
MERVVDRSISAALFTDAGRGDLPARSRTVVVGGGIIGASVAHQLAEAGEEVLLVEANVLGSGTSWHAAGLVSGSRASSTLTALARYSRSIYEGLERRTGIDVNWRRTGSLSMARIDGRVDELRYQRDVAVQGGVEAILLGPSEIREHWSLADPTGVKSGLLIPGDGHVNPGYAAIAFAKLAHESGATVREHVKVAEVLTSGGRVTGVRTDQGDVEAERVVLAAGLWTRDLARTAGAHIPLYAAEHVHVRTNPIEGAVATLPVLRDLDASYYIRHEDGRLLVGAFEPQGKPRPVDQIPTSGFAEFAPDWDHFHSVRVQAERTVPAMQSAGYDRFLNAPESFTPDANFILGETGEVANLFTAAGMNSQGIIFAPAVGRELAAWMLAGAPQFDASSVDVRRFSRHQANRRYLHDRTREGLGRLYAMHWPNLQMSTARNVRRSPLHERVAANGAAFGEVNGWERANWYEEPGAAAEVVYSYHRASWFDRVAEEHRAARENIAIFDLSPFAKIEVAGPDALAVVQRTFTSNLDVPIGRAVYTLQLNSAGGIALDGTVTRLADDRFLVVMPSATQDATLAILRKAATGAAAAVFDATAGFATILVTGPRSRDLLERVSPEDWSDDAQPHLTGRQIEIADGFAYALRVSFTGELAYELYVTSDLAVNVFDAVWAAGKQLGARLAGYYALDSLRSEKGFRHLGHDMGPTDDPRSSGLWFAVDLDKGDFIGRAAVAASTPADLKHRTVYFSIDDPQPVLVHDETVLRDGVVVGRVLSGSFGHTLGRAVGLAAIDPSADIESGNWTVECGGRPYAASFSRRPLYDPAGTRMRG